MKDVRRVSLPALNAEFPGVDVQLSVDYGFSLGQNCLDTRLIVLGSG